MIDDETKKWLEGVVGFVEASSAEKQNIWKECVEWGKKWEQDSSGWLLKAGEIVVEGEKYPIMVSLFCYTIDGHRLALYHSTSRFVDHDMVRKWVEEIAPKSAFYGGRLNHSDAMNWYNVIHAADVARKEAAK